MNYLYSVAQRILFNVISFSCRRVEGLGNGVVQGWKLDSVDPYEFLPTQLIL